MGTKAPSKISTISGDPARGVFLVFDYFSYLGVFSGAETGGLLHYYFQCVLVVPRNYHGGVGNICTFQDQGIATI